EVRLAGELDDRLAERIVSRSGRVETDFLDALRAADPEVAQLGRVIDAVIVGEARIRRVEQHEPDGLTARLALVERQADGLLAQVDLNRTLERQMGPEPGARPWAPGCRPCRRHWRD